MHRSATRTALAFTALTLTACSGETAPAELGAGSTTGGECRVVPASAPHGHALWSNDYLALESGNVEPDDVVVDSHGSIVMSAALDGAIAFGTSSLTLDGVSGRAFVAKLDPAGCPLWIQRLMPLKPIPVIEGARLNVDGHGDIYASYAGYYSDHRPAQAYLAKLDGGTGKELWRKSYGPLYWIWLYRAAPDDGGHVFIAGNLSGNVDLGGVQLDSLVTKRLPFIAKLDEEGAALWAKVIGNQEGKNLSSIWDIVADDLGGMTVAGTFFGTLDLGGGPLLSGMAMSTFIASFDANGVHRWSRARGPRHFARSGGGALLAMGGESDACPSGGLAVAKMDVQSGSTAWARCAPSNVFVNGQIHGGADDQGFIGLAGIFTGELDLGGPPLEAGVDGRMFSARLGPSGQTVWVADLGLEDDSSNTLLPSGGITAASASPDGHLVVLGTAMGSIDLGAGMIGGVNPRRSLFVAALAP